MPTGTREAAEVFQKKGGGNSNDHPCARLCPQGCKVDPAVFLAPIVAWE